MKKIWLTLLSAALMSGVVLSWGASSAQARPGYEKVFADKYGTDVKDAWEKVGVKDDEGKVSHCNTCHVAGKKKDERNVYGQALAKTGLKKEADAKKVGDAMDKVAAMHSNPKDDKSPTFGELIKSGKLPGSK